MTYPAGLIATMFSRTAIAVAVDAFVKYVTLLLNGESNNNAIEDNSTLQSPITQSGVIKPDTVGPFLNDGCYSVKFNGSTDFFYVAQNAALTFGTGDFTVEAWLFPTSRNLGTFWSNTLSSGVNGIQIHQSAVGAIGVATATTSLYVGVKLLDLHKWTHVAVVRTGGFIKVYLDGVLDNTAANSTNLSNSNFTVIGALNTSAAQPYAGHISNLRVVKGSAVYTSNFSVPTSPLTVIANTSLLTCQSSKFKDASVNAFGVLTGAATSIPMVSGFGPFTGAAASPLINQSQAAAVHFDGVSYCTVPAGAIPYMAAGTSYTLEAWIYCTAYTTGDTWLFSTTQAGSGAFAYTITSTGAIRLYQNVTNSGTGVLTSAVGAIRRGVWTHIAMVRTGSVIRAYVDGALIMTVSSDGTTINSATLYIGSPSTAPNHSSFSFNGFISNLRLVAGTAVYTAAFTPPTTPLTAISGTTLLTFQNYGGGSNRAIIDGSQIVAPVFNVGSPTLTSFSPSSPKGWSGYFNGATDYISIANSSVFNLGSSDFTMEAWINIAANGAEQFIFDNVTGTGWRPILLYINASGTIGLAFSGGSSYILSGTTTSALQPNKWAHIALVRNGSNVTIYVDGVANVLSTSFSAALMNMSGTPLIGVRAETNARFFKGFISDFRLVNGTAIYTAAFTPPSTRLTAVAGTALLTLQDYRFKDNSTNAALITPNGNVSAAAQSPFSPQLSHSFASLGGSMYFNGSSRVVRSSAGVNLAGSNDFTVQAWIYMTTTSGHRGIMGVRPSAQGAGWCLYVSPTHTLQLGGVVGGNGYAEYALNTQVIRPFTWNHVALVRTADGYRGYVNGVPGTLVAQLGGLHFAHPNIAVGALSSDGELPFTGYISNPRIDNGTAMFTSQFTPAHSVSTPGPTTTYLINTAAKSGGIVDASGTVDVFTTSGSNSTKQKKFGLSALRFLGDTANTLVVQASPSNAFNSGDFTIEAWVYIPSRTTEQIIISTRGSSGSTTGFSFSIQASTGYLTMFSSATKLTSTIGVNVNVWTHVAIMRTGSTLTAFVNGVACGTGSTSENYTNDVLGVGCSNDSAQFPLTGYIDDLRITKTSRYQTSGFDVPSAAGTVV